MKNLFLVFFFISSLLVVSASTKAPLSLYETALTYNSKKMKRKEKKKLLGVYTTIITNLIDLHFPILKNSKIKILLRNSEKYLATARPKLTSPRVYKIAIGHKKVLQILNMGPDMNKQAAIVEGLFAHELSHLVAYYYTIHGIGSLGKLSFWYFDDFPRWFQFLFYSCEKKASRIRNKRARFERWTDAYAIFQGFTVGEYNVWAVAQTKKTKDKNLKKRFYIFPEEETIWRDQNRPIVQAWYERFEKVHNNQIQKQKLTKFIEEFPLEINNE